MISRLLYDEEKNQYNQVVDHPVQTWEWGDFQASQGHSIYRFGIFNQKKLIGGYTVSFHRLPKLPYSVGTLLRGPVVDADMISNLTKLAKQENAIFVKLEPNVHLRFYDQLGIPKEYRADMTFPGLVVSPKVAFYPFSYLVDLTKSEDDLLSAMHSKTRYNIKIAYRHQVEIVHSQSDADFDSYLDLLFQTTRRQGFYLHSPQYHQTLWRILKPTGIPHLLLAKYQGEILAAFMLFVHHHKLYYPYGASLDTNRQVMAPTLLMWEAIRFGKSQNLKSFDMWGSLGPDAKDSDPGFGFHRFKQGYGGNLAQFVGTYDLVSDPSLYKLYNLADQFRWKLLRFKAKIAHGFSPNNS